jgi:hypothetical protein
MRLPIAALCTFAWVIQFAKAAPPAAPPATQPATALMLNGRIEFTPPAGWKQVKNDQSPEMMMVYIADDHDGFFRLVVLPENAAIDADAARKYVAQLRNSHKNANQDMVKGPDIEKDDRFAIRIHERYKIKDKTADETYLYRLVNGRAMELQVQSISDDAAHVAGVHKTAEDVLLSAHAKEAPPAAPVNIGTLMNGKIEFNQPPAPWTRAKLANLSDDSAAAFGMEENDRRMMMLRILPSNASIGPAVARDIVFSLRTGHKKANEAMVMVPTIEKDARFPIRIHERFKDKDGKVVDETHFYLQIAGRAAELDVHTVSEDPVELNADRKLGEEILLSTHWKARTPPAKKRGK